MFDRYSGPSGPSGPSRRVGTYPIRALPSTALFGIFHYIKPLDNKYLAEIKEIALKYSLGIGDPRIEGLNYLYKNDFISLIEADMLAKQLMNLEDEDGQRDVSDDHMIALIALIQDKKVRQIPTDKVVDNLQRLNSDQARMIANGLTREEAMSGFAFDEPEITPIGDRAFFERKDLITFTLPEGHTFIGKEAFSGCSGLTEIILPESLTWIGEAAFHDCADLTVLILPDGLASISAWTFSRCRSLTAIRFSLNLTTIGEGAFSDCTALTAITLPKGVTTIGAQAFFFCDNLTDITLPESLVSIGEEAFDCCTSLKQIIINTLDPEKYEKIKSLLTLELQEKVLGFDDFKLLSNQKIKTIQSQCLGKLIKRLEINPLYQKVLLGDSDNSFLSTVPLEIRIEIIKYTNSNNRYYAKAQKQLDALGLPNALTEEALAKYQQDCEIIVNKNIRLAIPHPNDFATAAKEKQTFGFFANEQQPVQSQDNSREAIGSLGSRAYQFILSLFNG